MPGLATLTALFARWRNLFSVLVFAGLGLLLGAVGGVVGGFLIGVLVVIVFGISCFDSTCEQVAVAMGVLGFVSCGIGGFITGILLGRRITKRS